VIKVWKLIGIDYEKKWGLKKMKTSQKLSENYSIK